MALALVQAGSGQSAGAKPEVVGQTRHTSALSRPVFSPDGRLLASVAFAENSVKLWELDSGRQLRSFELPRQNQVSDTVGVSDLTFSGDGRFLAGCTRSEIDVWNVTDGQSVYRFPIKNGPGLGTLSQFSFYDVPGPDFGDQRWYTAPEAFLSSRAEFVALDYR